MEIKLGRNDPCRCGSGKKYKHCCLGRDEEAARAARAKAAAEAPPPIAEVAIGGTAPVAPKHRTDQPWKKIGFSKHGFGKTNLPRKIGSG